MEENGSLECTGLVLLHSCISGMF